MKLNFTVERGENVDSQLFSVGESACAAQDEDYVLNSIVRNEIVLDKGASQHVLCDISLLSEVH